MKFWEVKKGNTSVQDILIKDKDDNTVTDLAEATEIKFQIKKKKTDAVALVEKTKDDGIAVDSPSAGYLKITLLPTDTGTTLSVGDYFMAVQIKWNATKIYEANIYIDDIRTERFRIKQDIVL